jgi:hypothetical protein
MARKPDGKPASVDRVSFTRPAAERIGKAVRQVEAGDRDLGPIEWGPRGGGAASKVFRVCTFTGAWSINTAKTVTFRNVTSTPNTVSATNEIIDLPAPKSTSTSRVVNIGKDGTAWYLVSFQLATATAVLASATQTITYISPGSTQTITYAGPGSTQQLTFLTGVQASLNTANCSISVTPQTQSITLATAGSTQTATTITVAATQTAVITTGTVTATYVTLEI